MKISKFTALVPAVLSNLYLASAAYAQVDSYLPESPINKELMPWVSGVINIAIGLAALACVGILIFSGYMYITAAGDENKVEKATKSLTYAIVGLVICFIAVILVQFVLTKILV